MLITKQHAIRPRLEVMNLNNLVITLSKYQRSIFLNVHSTAFR